MRTSTIGGETAHRSFLGSSMSKARAVALIVSGTGAVVLMGIFRMNGILPAALLVAVSFLVTVPTHNGTLAARIITNRRWAWAQSSGARVFIPFQEDLWDRQSRRVFALTGIFEGKERRDAMRVLAAIRERPLGVEGMVWLREDTATPGIAWHQGPGGDEHLTVTFTTHGQVAGMQSDSFVERSAEMYGRLLARLGEHSSLLKRVQSLTRVLPVDSALHESWVVDNLDQEVAPALASSYDSVIRELRSGQLFQRHMFVLVWPITDRFRALAGRRGAGRDGWLALMDQEIASALASFRQANFSGVRVLTARRTAATIRHMQHPGFGIDRVSDVTTGSAYLPSEDEYSYTKYTGCPGPDGVLEHSYVRTARIEASSVEVIEYGSMWLTPLLSGMHEQVVRTVSFHLEVIPATVARTQAVQDVTSDKSVLNRNREEGVEADDETEVTLGAATRRRMDLKPGTGNAGANWVGYVSVTGSSVSDLINAVEAAEAAASKCGISKLRWLDTQHAEAAAFTWPVGRGLLPSPESLTERLSTKLAGTGSKEQL